LWANVPAVTGPKVGFGNGCELCKKSTASNPPSTARKGDRGIESKQG
jgi:hypothetical protein